MQIKRFTTYFFFLLPTLLFSQKKDINLSASIGIANPRFIYEDRPNVNIIRKPTNHTIGNYLEFRTNYKKYYLTMGYMRVSQKFQEINTLANKLGKTPKIAPLSRSNLSPLHPNYLQSKTPNVTNV